MQQAFLPAASAHSCADDSSFSQHCISDTEKHRMLLKPFSLACKGKQNVTLLMHRSDANNRYQLDLRPIYSCSQHSVLLCSVCVVTLCVSHCDTILLCPAATVGASHVERHQVTCFPLVCCGFDDLCVCVFTCVCNTHTYTTRLWDLPSIITLTTTDLVLTHSTEHVVPCCSGDENQRTRRDVFICIYLLLLYGCYELLCHHSISSNHKHTCVCMRVCPIYQTLPLYQLSLCAQLLQSWLLRLLAYLS